MPEKLIPVSSPVDAFVAPGVRGPLQTNFDFGALRGLSATLDQIATEETARAERKAQDIAKEQEPKLALLTKAQFQVLNSQDPVTQEQQKLLKDAGIEGADNPWAINLLRKASGVYQVREAGYKSFLRDPQWVAKVSETAAYSPDAAQQMIEQRRNEFLKEHLGSLGEFAKSAAAAEISMEEQQFRAELEPARRRQFDALQERAATLALQPALDLGVNILNGGGESDALAQKFRESILVARDQQKNTLGIEKTNELWARALGNSLTNLARSDGPAALHSLDFVRDAVKDDPTMTEMIDRVEGDVNQTINARRVRQQNEYPKASRELQGVMSRTISQMMTEKPLNPDELRQWLFEGDGQTIVGQIAEKNGVDPGELNSELPGVFGFWSRQSGVSEEKQVNELLRMVRNGDPQQAEVVLDASPEIGPSSRTMLYNAIDAKKKEPTQAPEAKAKRNQTINTVVGEMGPLPDASAPDIAATSFAAESAFDAWIKEHPEDYQGAHVAGYEAAKKTPSYARMVEQARINQYEAVVATPTFKSGVTQTISAYQELDLRQASTLETPTSATDNLQKWAKIRSQVDAEMRTAYEELKSSPEIRAKRTQEERNDAIAYKLSEFVPEAIQRAQGISVQKAPAPEQLEMTSDNQIQRMSTLGQITPSRVEELAPLVNKATVDSATNSTVSAVKGALSGIATGHPDGFYYLYGIGPDAEYDMFERLAIPDKSPSKLLSMGLALEAQLVDGAKLSGYDDSWSGAALGNMPAQDAAHNYRSFLTAKGLGLKEVIAGQTNGGVPLQKVFGSKTEPWFTAFPVQQIPLFATPADMIQAREDLDTRKESSQVYKALKALRLDPDNPKAVDFFFNSQKAVLEARAGIGYGFEMTFSSTPTTENQRIRYLKNIYSETPQVSPSDPEWLKKAKQRRIDAEN